MRQFQFRWIPSLATFLLLAVFLRLGWWQWHKALDVERQMQFRTAHDQDGPLLLGAELVQASEVNGARVLVRGHFEKEGQFFLDNQQYQGRPGVHVITPLQIEGTQVRVLVNRGWLAWGASRDVLPEVSIPSVRVEVQGRAVVPADKPPAFVTEPAQDDGVLRTRIRMNDIQTRYPHALQPMVVYMEETSAPDALVRDWPEPESKAPMHKGYAVQWGGMALLLLGFFLRSSYRRLDE